MKVLVTGSAGHLGEALMRTLIARGDTAAGLDILFSPFTTQIGSVADRDTVRQAMAGAEVVLHAATLHKPHVATHTRQDFIDTNITGTLNLLEEAAAAGVRAFVLTSTTSVFGDALTPGPGEPAAWITEDVAPRPKNIYGVTKAAAEDLGQLFHRNHRLNVIVLRTSRFFPEADDSVTARAAHADDNLKTNEYLHRRVALEDVVSAHLMAAERAGGIGFGKYIIGATSPFTFDDRVVLRRDPAAAARRHVPGFEAEYARRGWTLPGDISRVYVNDQARRELGWRPEHDFAAVVARLAEGGEVLGPLARAIGAKGYHAGAFADGFYPVDHA
jgi:UDP-glucose 4-epimerase